MIYAHFTKGSQLPFVGIPSGFSCSTSRHGQKTRKEAMLAHCPVITAHVADDDCRWGILPQTPGGERRTQDV